MPLYNQLMTKYSKSAKSGSASKKNRYRKYKFETRNRLIEFVETEGKTITWAANELGIAQTSARLIIKTWRQSHRVFEKKADQEKRLRRERDRKRKEEQKLKKKQIKIEEESVKDLQIKEKDLQTIEVSPTISEQVNSQAMPPYYPFGYFPQESLLWMISPPVSYYWPTTRPVQEAKIEEQE